MEYNPLLIINKVLTYMQFCDLTQKVEYIIINYWILYQEKVVGEDNYLKTEYVTVVMYIKDEKNELLKGYQRAKLREDNIFFCREVSKIGDVCASGILNWQGSCRQWCRCSYQIPLVSFASSGFLLLIFCLYFAHNSLNLQPFSKDP
jgi:hypothetical protein